MNFTNRIAKYFSIGGYDGAESPATSGNHRRPGPTQNASEDSHLDSRKREILSANTRDILRQYSLLGWTLRRHLDFVVDFSFKAQTDDAGFNRDLESWFAEISRPNNFDVAGRHSFDRALRISEACRTLDGDVFWMKLRSGPNRGKIQFIEADRVMMPASEVPRGEEEAWVNGCKVDPRTGKTMAYAISNRTRKGQKQLDRIVSAKNILPLGYYSYKFDQIRGVSPLACAVNQLRDLYEVQNYEVVKAKLGALLGVAIMRETGAYDTATLGEAVDDGDGPPVIDFSHMGPFSLELAPGEKAEILESKTPSPQTLAFIQHLIDATLLALDIPASFFDVARTNYFGSRAALLIYLLSCDDKIRDLKQFQNDYLNWRLGIALEDGDITLPSGREFDFVKFEFIEGGVPYWKPADEAKGTAMQIAMGLQSPRRAARELGRDFETILRETAEDIGFANALGVPLTFAESTAFNPEITVGAVDES
jgi:capsid protein